MSSTSDNLTASSPTTGPLGLKSVPFADVADDAYFFPSDQHLRALEFMGHTLWTKARLGVVTAESGSGKSLLISRLLRGLDEQFVVASVQREGLTPRDFLLQVLRGFGVTLSESDKTDHRRLLEHFLTHQATMGRICVLVVENAQSMHPSVLEELRSMAALQVEGIRAVKLLLLGQPSLDHVLRSPRMGGLMDASVPRFVLGPLSEDQTSAYVAHRLRAAGADDPDALMPPALMRSIYGYTGGNPSRINRLCEQAITYALVERAPYVSSNALNLAAAANEMHWLAGVSRQTREPAYVDPDARLVISMQGSADREIALSNARLLIGRSERADVRIESVFASRYHALLIRDGNQDLLLDLGSTNGLLVNSRRVVRSALKHNDLIQIGPARIVYLNSAAQSLGQIDPSETVCFARPGFPADSDAVVDSTVLGFGRP
jgi:general secretion pathway protein A